VRSTYALHNLQALDFKTYNYILDIDIDFREGKSAEQLYTDIQKIKTLINNACLITIATSPYFIDQTHAIAITKKLLQ
jgi:vesicle coat complex subunit